MQIALLDFLNSAVRHKRRRTLAVAMLPLPAAARGCPRLPAAAPLLCSIGTDRASVRLPLQVRGDGFAPALAPMLRLNLATRHMRAHSLLLQYGAASAKEPHRSDIRLRLRLKDIVLN